MMNTKYEFDIPDETLRKDNVRLINQLWKVLPMKEHEEDWKKQLKTVQYEILGLNEIFNHKLNFLILLSKIESLFMIDDFLFFRKTIFEAIDLLGGLMKNE